MDVFYINIENNIVFYFQNFFEMTQNILNEVRHRKLDLEQFKKEKVALEEKLGEEEASAESEDTQRLLECIGVIGKHSREIKKFEDWMSEKTTLPLKFEKVVSSFKLKAGVMASVPLSVFSDGGKGTVSIGFLSLPVVCVGVESVRTVEPVEEESQVNPQILAKMG